MFFERPLRIVQRSGGLSVFIHSCRLFVVLVLATSPTFSSVAQAVPTVEMEQNGAEGANEVAIAGGEWNPTNNNSNVAPGMKVTVLAPTSPSMQAGPFLERRTTTHGGSPVTMNTIGAQINQALTRATSLIGSVGFSMVRTAGGTASGATASLMARLPVVQTGGAHVSVGVGGQTSYFPGAPTVTGIKMSVTGGALVGGGAAARLEKRKKERERLLASSK